MIQTHIEQLRLLTTTRKDVPVIHHYIKQMAIYEKLEDQMQATESLLEQSLFVQHAAEVFLIEYDLKICGFVLITKNFSTFVGKPGMYLEDIYVDENLRGLGIGSEIFVQLAKIAQDRNYGRLEWCCLNWNEPSIQFYLKMGATVMEDWKTYRLNEQSMTDLVENKSKRKGIR
ncbi:N-acetyltransferase [Erysipelotrichaceae bacterium]|nr:N-acetyltransferase [Erysipelotrichaceae bacterium]